MMSDRACSKQACGIDVVHAIASGQDHRLHWPRSVMSAGGRLLERAIEVFDAFL